ncbi:MAG: NADH-quinone oxidoreductase subunit J [Armatimonadota bacterium]|nr:NADH-quinone oxidoreductase subunit J [Armatimonadota bacterium]
MGQLAAFIALSMITLAAAVVVVGSGNIVRSALSLIPTFLGITGLYILLQAEFVAGIQVLIYAGAITVLILFVIMLTEHGSGIRFRQVTEQVPLGMIVAGGLAAFLVATLATTPWALSPATLPQYTARGVGTTLLTSMILVFEVTSLVLLVALIGAVVIARRER